MLNNTILLFLTTITLLVGCSSEPENNEPIDQETTYQETHEEWEEEVDHEKIDYEEVLRQKALRESEEYSSDLEEVSNEYNPSESEMFIEEEAMGKEYESGEELALEEEIAAGFDDVITGEDLERQLGGGQEKDIILIFSVNERIDSNDDRKIILDAIKKKWLSSRNYTAFPRNPSYTKGEANSFYQVLSQYEGRVVLKAEVLYIYGKWEIAVDVSIVKKEDGSLFLFPIDNWRKEHADTADRLAKEIRYGKDLKLRE